MEPQQTPAAPGLQPPQANPSRVPSSSSACMPSALRDASNKAGPKKGRSRSPTKRRAKPAASTAAASTAAAHTAPAAAGAKQAAGKPTVGGAKAGAELLAAMAPQHREASRLLYREFCQQVRHKQAAVLRLRVMSALRNCLLVVTGPLRQLGAAQPWKMRRLPARLRPAAARTRTAHSAGCS